MKAEQIVSALQYHDTPMSCPAWVKPAALIFRPNKWDKLYKTTVARFYTEVTVRFEAEKIAKRSGKPYQGLQRRLMDMVGLIQPNKNAYEPLIIGTEIKVAKYDLLKDTKISDYLPYCHLFYLAVPEALEQDAIKKLSEPALNPIGLLTIKHTHVTIKQQSDLQQPSDVHLKEIYAELLLKPIKNERERKPLHGKNKIGA